MGKYWCQGWKHRHKTLKGKIWCERLVMADRHILDAYLRNLTYKKTHVYACTYSSNPDRPDPKNISRVFFLAETEEQARQRFFIAHPWLKQPKSLRSMVSIDRFKEI